MFEVPDHLPIPVDREGRGPLADNDPHFDHIECWCADGLACNRCYTCQGSGVMPNMATCIDCHGSGERTEPHEITNL